MLTFHSIPISIIKFISGDVAHVYVTWSRIIQKCLSSCILNPCENNFQCTSRCRTKCYEWWKTGFCFSNAFVSQMLLYIPPGTWKKQEYLIFKSCLYQFHVYIPFHQPIYIDTVKWHFLLSTFWKMKNMAANVLRLMCNISFLTLILLTGSFASAPRLTNWY